MALLAAPVGAAERIAAVSLPAAPLAPSLAAPPSIAALPSVEDFRPMAGISAAPAIPAGEHSRRAAEIPVAALAEPSAQPARVGAPRGPGHAAAALAAISDFAAHAPPASASVEDAAAHVRALAGLMMSETVRGPPQPAPAAAPAPETGVVRVADVGAALAALRAASHPRHEESDALIARLAAEHPELPLSAEDVFLVKDASILPEYGVPDIAGGAARIVSDGRRERKVVIVVAPRGVALDDFVEYSIHEAVHLQDDGILRISHERFLEHWLAEGWTQLRAHAMANDSLRALGRPERPNGAYSREVALVRAFIARYSEAPLRELVERGSPAGLAKALGSRWDGLLALAAENPSSAARQREYFLRIIQVVVEHPGFGPLDFRNASRALYGERPS